MQKLTESAVNEHWAEDGESYAEKTNLGIKNTASPNPTEAIEFSELLTHMQERQQCPNTASTEQLKGEPRPANSS